MCGRSKLGHRLKILLIVILMTYTITSVILYTSTDVFSSKDSSKDSTIHLPPSTEKSADHDVIPQWPHVQRSNVIVNSYMRGGSSFLGRLLGYHPDSFYIYEPLWKYNIWDYYKQSTLQCNSRDCTCWRSQESSTMVDKVNAMVSCTGFQHVVVAKMTAFYSGVPWMNFTSCIHPDPNKRLAISNSDQIPLHCHYTMQLECLRYRHTVGKVLRLTVDMYEKLLNNTNDTKVIHLFRDPRAILNSRLKTKWYPVTSLSDIAPNAKCLCKRILLDYEAGLKLAKAYPERFKIVFYEDLFENLVVKTDKLYEYVGIRSVNSIGKTVFEGISNFGYKSDHALRSNSTDYASWWRQSLDWEAVTAIDNVCQTVYTALGYQPFQTEASLRDRNVKSYVVPEIYQL